MSGNAVFVAADRSTYALFANTGDELRRYNADTEPYFTAQAVFDDILYVASNTDLLALNAATGSLKYQYQSGRQSIPSLLVFDGIAYADSYVIDGPTGKHLRYMSILNIDIFNSISFIFYNPMSNGIISGQ